MATSAAEVLLYASKPERFGLGLSNGQIASIFAVRSIVSFLTGPWLYPLLSSFGSPESVFRYGVWHLLLLTFGFFGIAHLARFGYFDRGSAIPALISLNLISSFGTSTATACLQSLSSRAPSRGHLAKTTSLTEYAGNTAHLTGAFLGSSLFASFGQSRLPGGSNNVWLVLAFLSACLGLYAQYATHEPGWREVNELDNSAEGREEP